MSPWVLGAVSLVALVIGLVCVFRSKRFRAWAGGASAFAGLAFLGAIFAILRTKEERREAERRRLGQDVREGREDATKDREATEAALSDAARDASEVHEGAKDEQDELTLPGRTRLDG